MKVQNKNSKIKNVIVLSAVIGTWLLGTTTIQASVLTPKTERVSRVNFQPNRVDHQTRVSEKASSVFMPVMGTEATDDPTNEPDSDQADLRKPCAQILGNMAVWCYNPNYAAECDAWGAEYLERDCGGGARQ